MSLHSQYKKTHAALELSDSLVQAKNVHGSLFFFLFRSFALHRPRIITFFFCVCVRSREAFSTSLNAIKAMTTFDDFVANTGYTWLLYCAVLFFVLHNFLYFYSHFYGYALFILTVVV